MGIPWSQSNREEEEESFPFDFLDRTQLFARRGNPPPIQQQHRSIQRPDSTSINSGDQSGNRRSIGERSVRNIRNLLRMSNDDDQEGIGQQQQQPQETTTNRPSVESDYDDREDESIAAILSSLIRSGQFRLISPEGSYSDDLTMETSGGARSESSDERDPRMSGGGGVGATTASLKSIDIKTIVELHTGEYSTCNRTMANRRNVVNRLRDRELGGAMRQSTTPACSYLTQGDQCYINNHVIPNVMTKIDTYRSKVFCGQYTKDGRVLITACQDQRIRFYDMTKLSDAGVPRSRSSLEDSDSISFNAPAKPGLQFHSVEAKDVGWSILDLAVSPDGRHVVYSSWSDYIHQCDIYEAGDEHHAAFHLHPGEYRFCVFSLRFSADGNEILAGASDRCLYVYDRQRNTRTLKIACHEDDVNAVCFADDASQIVYSGGDDGLCKVWDRRTLSEDHPKPVGVLAGHADGITFIDSKGDARYLISNSKDQSIKLWDIRKFSSDDAMQATREAVAKQGWDYRWQNVPRKVLKYQHLQGDTSVMTYRDHHTVLHTLIRSYFSPAFNTGQKYVYTGCASGACVIYDVITGDLVKRLKAHHACVRDVSWHPYRNEIVTASWDAMVARWIYDGRADSDYEEDSSETYSDDSSDDCDIGFATGIAAGRFSASAANRRPPQTASGRLMNLYRRRMGDLGPSATSTTSSSSRQQQPVRRSERLRERQRRGIP